MSRTIRQAPQVITIVEINVRGPIFRIMAVAKGWNTM